MMVVLVDKLLKTQIVEPSAVANWLFSSEMQPEFTKYARFMLFYVLQCSSKRYTTYWFLHVHCTSCFIIDLLADFMSGKSCMQQ